MTYDPSHLASPPIPPEDSPENGHSWADALDQETKDSAEIARLEYLLKHYRARSRAMESSRDQFMKMYRNASQRADEQQCENVRLWAELQELKRERP